MFAICLLMAAYAKSQQTDTTVTLRPNTRIEIELPVEKMWWPMKNTDCINFEYPTPWLVIIKSKCSEAQKVTLKKGKMIQIEEDPPLLDVPRPKDK